MTNILFSSWGGVVTDNRRKLEAERQPVSTLNLPLELDKEKKIKAFVGWDGIVIRDPEVNMVDLIRAYLEAVQKESCGKCTPCRVGTRIMATIMNRIADGQGKVEDLKTIKIFGWNDFIRVPNATWDRPVRNLCWMRSIILKTNSPVRSNCRKRFLARNIKSR